MTTITSASTPEAGGAIVAGPAPPRSSVAAPAPENSLSDISLELETHLSLKPPSLEEVRALWALARS